MKHFYGISTLIVLANTAFATVTISVDRVQPRFPWNGLVDIDYTIEGIGDDENALAYALEVKGTYGGETETLTNFATYAWCDLPTANGAHRITWDSAAAGCTNRVGSMTFALAISKPAITRNEADYMIVDVSGGTAATSYPIRYIRNAAVSGTAFNLSRYKTDCVVLKRLPAGNFLMGEGKVSEAKSRHVTLTKDFFLGVFPLTQRQYTLVYGKNESRHTTGTDAQEILERAMDSVKYNNYTAEGKLLPLFNAKTAAFDATATGFFFPTEAQWEYACRAGTTNSQYWGEAEDASVVDQYAWYNGNSGGRTHGVGRKLPNAWGFYDMSGNMQEYCSDWYASPFDTTQGAGTADDPAVDPTGPETGTKKVSRGGSWTTDIGSGKYWYTYLYLGSGYRNYNWDPAWSDYYQGGMRLSLTLDVAGQGEERSVTTLSSASMAANIDTRSGAVHAVTDSAAMLPLAWTTSATWARGGASGVSATLAVYDMSGSDASDPSTWVESSAATLLVEAGSEESTVVWAPTARRCYKATLAADGKVFETAYFDCSGDTSLAAVTDLATAQMTLAYDSIACDGYPKTPAVTIKVGETPLVEGTDYTLVYADNAVSGHASVTAIGCGTCAGMQTKYFTLVAQEVQTVASAESAIAKAIDATAEAVRKPVHVNDILAAAYNSAADWIKDGDAEVVATIRRATMAGDAEGDPSTWTVGEQADVFAAAGEGVCAVTNELKKVLYRFELLRGETVAETAYYDLTDTEGLISTKPMTDCSFTLSVSSFPCDGYPKTPTVAVTNAQGVALVEGVDYVVKYADNVNVGTATLSVIGAGNYAGQKDVAFSIVPLAPQTLGSASADGLAADLRADLVYATKLGLLPLTWNSTNTWAIGGAPLTNLVGRISVARVESAEETPAAEDYETLFEATGEGNGIIWRPKQIGLYYLKLEYLNAKGKVIDANATLTRKIDIRNVVGFAIIIR